MLLIRESVVWCSWPSARSGGQLSRATLATQRGATIVSTRDSSSPVALRCTLAPSAVEVRRSLSVRGTVATAAAFEQTHSSRASVQFPAACTSLCSAVPLPLSMPPPQKLSCAAAAGDADTSRHVIVQRTCVMHGVSMHASSCRNGPEGYGSFGPSNLYAVLRTLNAGSQHTCSESSCFAGQCLCLCLCRRRCVGSGLQRGIICMRCAGVCRWTRWLWRPDMGMNHNMTYLSAAAVVEARRPDKCGGAEERAVLLWLMSVGIRCDELFVWMALLHKSRQRSLACAGGVALTEEWAPRGWGGASEGMHGR